MVPGYRSGLRSSARVRLYRVIGTGYSSAAEREGGNRHQRRRSSGTQNASSRELRRICPVHLAARHFHRDARHAGVAHTFALPCACGWTRHPCLRCFSGARKFQTADGRHGYDPYCPCRNGLVAPYGSHWAVLAMTGTTWLTAMGSMASIPRMSELRTLMILRAATKRTSLAFALVPLPDMGGASLMFPRDESRVFADFRGVA